MRSTRNVWVTGDREDTDLAGIWVVGKLAVEVIKVVSPYVLDISRVHPPVAVGAVLDEHHGWQIVDIPTARDLYKTGLSTSDQRLHPSLGFLRVVDLGPCILITEVERLRAKARLYY